VMKRRFEWWSSRLVRMIAFGAVYAVVLAALVSPSVAGMLVYTMYGYSHGVFLPSYVNPFVAADALVEMGSEAYRAGLYGGYGGPYGGPYGDPMGYAPVVATLIFAAGTLFLLRHLAGFRFEAMRRKR
jgi:hypothetical protein